MSYDVKSEPDTSTVRDPPLLLWFVYEGDLRINPPFLSKAEADAYILLRTRLKKRDQLAEEAEAAEIAERERAIQHKFTGS